jgi:hypothetical protein
MTADWRAWAASALLASPLLYGVVDMFRTGHAARPRPYPVVRRSRLRGRRHPLTAGPGEALVCRSVVDIRPDVHLRVGGHVEARNAQDFPVGVTFRCTVVDPVAVVRARVRDLHGFLREGLALASFDGAYAPEDGPDLRRALTTRLERARFSDAVPGVRIVLDDVEVGAAYTQEA